MVWAQLGRANSVMFGTPQSMQVMVVEDADVEFVAAVSQFDMTVADSEDSDSSLSVLPRHGLLGDFDTELMEFPL